MFVHKSLWKKLPPLISLLFVNIPERMGLLKTISKKVVIEEVIRGTIKDRKPGEVHWRVLVLDHFSSKVVSNCCGMQDITAEGVTLVEDLHKKREPLPFLEAIYLLKPTDEAIDLLFRDLDSDPPLYKAFHIFFLEKCSEVSMDKLSKVANAARVKTFKEVNMSFIPYESQVFMLEGNSTLDRLYYNSQDDSVVNRMAEQIATLCASLGEYPAIRYRSAFARNGELARALDLKLKEYKNVEPSMGEGGDKARSQLIIVDRGFDCTSPLLHELTFEAMIHDLLKIENDSYKYKGANGDEKQVFLDDDDNTWHKLKYMHIAEVSQRVGEDCKKFIESKNVNMGGGQAAVKDLQLMVKKLPQYQKELTTFSTQISMAEDCMKAFPRIERLCAVEQDLATGLDADGERIRDFMSQMNPIILDLSPTGFNDNEKLRLIILYIIAKNGISDDSLNKLLCHANINTELRRVVTNLKILGLNLIGSGFKDDNFERKNRENETTTGYKLSRWIPVLKDVIEFAISDTLDQRKFPYQTNRNAEIGYKAPTSTRYGNWHSKTGNPARSVPRLIIFVTGGITYSEIRAVYEVNKAQASWEIVIGSTEVLTPDKFLKNLDALTE